MADLVVSSEDLLVIETDGGATILEANAGGSTGPKGDTGAAGAQGASLVWKGNWSSATAYSPLDVVHRDVASGGNGKAYISIQAGTNKDPITESSYWQVIVERAASGVVLGPYETNRILGFVCTNPQGITLRSELIRPANSANVDWRRKNGSSASLPVSLAQGDIYEVQLSSVSGRVYVGYEVS